MVRSLGVPLAVAIVLLPSGASAQSVEDFYRGKTVSVIVGYPPADANDIYARLVARHIGRHIPGNPTVVARNMPGGGSLIAANHIFNAAPKDGTVLGLIVPTASLEERLGASNVRFKAAQFNWIGRQSLSRKSPMSRRQRWSGSGESTWRNDFRTVLDS
jgi:tripartite-type tricarboxylate transporter receptor subunit TctC